jgi:diacylglycerol kinase (ATP)
MGAYAVKGVAAVADLEAVPYRITVDGVTSEMQAVMALVANCGEIVPPFLRLRPGIAIDDGVFDVAVVNATTLVEGVEVLWRMMTGRIDVEHRLHFLRGEEVRVETVPPQPVELDGESDGTTPFTAKVVPHAIKVMVPGS